MEESTFAAEKLRFRRDGGFRILMMSDIQETLSPDPRTLPAMHALVERVQPDLVVLGGDNCNGLVLQSEEELRAYLDIFTAPMEERGIPWIHVFGNHDHDIPMDPIARTKLYEAYPHCFSGHTEGMHGVTNYMLPIYASEEDRVAYAVWGLDTGNEIGQTGIPADHVARGMRGPGNDGMWDMLHFDQLMWYWNTSSALEAQWGRKIPGTMFMHIAPWEFQYIVDNPEKTGAEGSMAEHMSLGAFNSGLFAAVLQRGDIRCIACGHSHEDCFAGEFCGVTLCLDACAGYSPYGIDGIRGGRVFEIREDDPQTVCTRMVHYRDL